MIDLPGYTPEEVNEELAEMRRRMRAAAGSNDPMVLRLVADLRLTHEINGWLFRACENTRRKYDGAKARNKQLEDMLQEILDKAPDTQVDLRTPITDEAWQEYDEERERGRNEEEQERLRRQRTHDYLNQVNPSAALDEQVRADQARRAGVPGHAPEGEA